MDIDLSTLSLEQQYELFKQLKQSTFEKDWQAAGRAKLKELAEEHKQKQAALEADYNAMVAEVAAQHGITDAEPVQASKVDKKRISVSSDKRTDKKPAKFRDPTDASNKWTGQGLAPKWLKPLLEQWGISAKQFKELDITDAGILEQVKLYQV